jgi:hypothetical protein
MAHIKRRIVKILKDDTLLYEEKISILRQWEVDSLCKERAATEGMGAVDGDDGEDLHAIEIALRKLGAEPLSGRTANL